MGVVVRRYRDFLILLIPTPLASVLFCSSIPTFCLIFLMFIYILANEHRIECNFKCFCHFFFFFVSISF